jgi:hypothetical protein
MARTSTTGVSYFANPKGGLSIRGPLDNQRLNGRISNPPRFGKLGGLDIPADKGFRENSFKIASPGMTGDNPIKRGAIGQSTSRSKGRRSGDEDTNWS